MKTKTKLGWLLVGLGVIFLIGGLIILTAVSLQGESGNLVQELPGLSFWEKMIDFVLALIAMDWDPMRIGVFVTLVGMALEGGGAYVLLADPGPKRRR